MTVLEELLIKIGFSVDKKELREAQRSIHDDLGKSKKDTAAVGKKNKALTNQAKSIEKIGKQKDKNQKLDKGADEADAKRADRQKKVNSELKAAVGLLGRFANGWVLAGIATTAFTMKNIATIDKIAKLSRSMGVASDDLEGLRYASELGGATADQMDNTIVKLTATIGAARRGVQNMGLAFLGLNIYKANGDLKTATDLIYDISAAIKGLPAAEQLDRLAMLGIGPEMLPVFKEDVKTLKEAVAEKTRMRVLNEAEKAAAERAATETTRAAEASAGLGRKTSALFAPFVRDVTGLYADLITGDPKRYKELVKETGYGAPAPRDIWESLGLGFISPEQRREQRQITLPSGPIFTPQPPVQQNVEISISGAQSPQDVAIQVKEVLTQEYRNAGNNANKSTVQ